MPSPGSESIACWAVPGATPHRARRRDGAQDTPLGFRVKAATRRASLETRDAMEVRLEGRDCGRWVALVRGYSGSVGNRISATHASIEHPLDRAASIPAAPR